MKSTRKSLGLSVISLVLCVSMFLGTTYAWFTDSVTSGTNKIIGGNLDIDLVMDKEENGTYVSIADEEGAIFDSTSGIAQNKSSDTLWEPGKTQIVYLGVKNLGTLALKYNILLDVTDKGLASALEYAIVDGAKKADLVASGIDSWTALKAVTGVQTGSFGDFTFDETTKKATIPAAENGTLDEIVNGVKDETDYFALAVHMKEDAGNEYMEKDIVIDVNISATQYTAENDSFDNQYDKIEAEVDDDDDDDLLWFDTSLDPAAVTSIVFTKTAPAAYDSASDAWSTWDSPANSTAYYNSNEKALTYVTSGDSFKMTDTNILKFGLSTLKGFEPSEADIIAFAQEEFEDESISTVDDIHAYDEMVEEDAYAYVVQEYAYSNPVSFTNVTALTGLDLWDVSGVTDFSCVFYGTKLITIDIEKWDTSSATNMASMFCGNVGLTTIKLGDKWDTSKVENMSNMFKHCPSLETLPTEGWNTSKVENMSNMFNHCSSLETLPTEGWNTSSLKDMSQMFYQCSSATSIPVSGFDTYNVTNMHGVFSLCKKIPSLDLSSWDTSNVTDMSEMFHTCESLTTLKVATFNTANVTNMEKMFNGCSELTELDLSGWNTAKVENMECMFENKDLSIFGIVGATAELSHIYVGSGWNTDSVTTSGGMFFGCLKLPNYNGTSDISKAYVGEGGYLETKPAA